MLVHPQGEVFKTLTKCAQHIQQKPSLFYPIKLIGQKEMESQTADQNKIQDRCNQN